MKNTIKKCFGRKIAPFLCEIGAFLIIVSCGTIKKSLEDRTEVRIKDSVAVNIVDSTVIHTKSVYKDYSGLLDTLTLEVEGKAKAKAWADTSKNLLVGKLEVEPSTDRVKTIFKDRIEYRDSIKIERKIETKEIVKTPAWAWRLLGFNVLVLIGAGLWLYFKGKLKLRI